MKLLKVISVREPVKTRYESPYDITVVKVMDGESIFDMHLDRNGYKKFKLEQELLKNGTDPKLLQEYSDIMYTIGRESGYEEGSSDNF